MADKPYYALVASLPRLEYFERAKYVPITREQLLSRLQSLHPDHLRQLQLASDLVRWQKQPRERTTGNIAGQYAEAMKIITHPDLREFVEYRMGQRTVVVGLRMRYRGESPMADRPWGVGRWTRRVARHWDDTDFGMSGVFGWIDDARDLIDARDAVGLERLQIEVVWRRLSALEALQPFSFVSVFAFVFKWDCVKRWLSYDADVAKENFQELATEVIRDHQQLFA
jgi:hypothetical protein